MVMAFSASIFSTPRLPTPPKERDEDLAGTVDDAIQYLDTSYSSPIRDRTTDDAPTAQSSLDTPPSSSPAPLSGKHEARPRERAKRLRFSAETSFCEAQVKPLPPSKEQNPAKSILKPYEQPLPSSAADQPSTFPKTHTIIDFASMLESVVKELGGRDLNAHYDAYLTLWRYTKAQDGHPDTKALLENLPRLEHFMKRDIAEAGSTPIGKKLKIQALQLASTLIWRLPPSNESHASGSQGVSNEFVSFLISQTLQVLEDETTTKEILRNQLFITTMPEIYIKVLNPARASKLLKCLHSIDERVTGNSIIQLRLMICRQVTQFHPAVALEEINGILPYLLHGLCSSDKETRSRAIETGVILGTYIGSRKRVAQSLRDMMSRTVSDQGDYVSHFEKRLVELIRASDNSHSAPQIWGLIMLILRGDTAVLHEWLTRKSWLKIIELCFNSSDTGLNLHAWTAWNRTIYAAQRLMIEHDSALRRLCHPFFGHLSRKSNNEWTMQVKTAAFSSYYLVLYYVFGQRLDSDKLQVCWDRTIGEMCRKLPGMPTGDRHRFARVLRALFGESSLKVWSSQRGLQTFKIPMKWEEVPRLDPAWIRRHIALILKTLRPLLTEPPTPIDSSSFAIEVWSSMLKAIAQAGEKEIKASREFRSAVADILNYLSRSWSTNKKPQTAVEQSGTSQIATFLELVRSSIEILGPMHWGEHILLRAQNGIFEAAGTPSKSGSESPSNRQLCSPIASIIRLLWNPPPQTIFSPALRAQLTTLMTTCLETRSACWARIDQICDCIASLEEPDDSNQRTVAAQIWRVLTSLAVSTIKDSLSESINNSMKWDHYQKLLHLIRFGLYFSDFRSIEIGCSLVHYTCILAKAESGDAGLLIAIAKPWLEILTKDELTYNSRAKLLYLGRFLEEDQPSPTAKAVEHVQRSINRPHGSSSLSPADWPEALLSAVIYGLNFSYANLEALDSSVDAFLSSAQRFIECFKSQLLGSSLAIESFLWKAQSALLLWICDSETKITKSQSRGYDIQRSFGLLWECILGALAKSSGTTDKVIIACEQSLIAGLRSRNKAFANSTIIGWNRILENHGEIHCPAKLRIVLTRLQAYTDVSVSPQLHEPTRSANHDDIPAEDTELFPWLEDETSQFNIEVPGPGASYHRWTGSTYRTPLAAGSSPAPKLSTPSKSINKQTPPRRLRHDDSQVQFIAVESSPLSRSPNIDSQMLTEHQKDVRSRQVAEVNLFPDLRSSPLANPSRRTGSNAALHTNDCEMHDVNQPVADEEPLGTNGARKSQDLQPALQLHEDSLDDVGGALVDERSSESGTTNDEAFVDALYNMTPAADDDDHANQHERVTKAAQDRSEAERAAVTGRVLQDRSPNSCTIPSSLDKDSLFNGKPAKGIERVEESFIGTEMTPAESSIEDVSQRTSISTPQATESQMGLAQANEAEAGGVDKDAASTPFSRQALGRKKSKRGRKSKTYSLRGLSDVDEVAQRSSQGTEVNFTQDEDTEQGGDIIVVEEPDESSPPLRTVLGRLGIALPDFDGSPSNSQTSSRKRQRAPSKLGRENYADTKPEVEERGDGCDDDGEDRRLVKSRRTSKRLSSQQEDSEATSESSRRKSKAKMTSILDRLRAVIVEVKSLESDPNDTKACSELIDLGARLQTEINAAVGSE